MDGGLKVPEALKRSGQFVITRSNIVELLKVTHVGSAINCAKLLLLKMNLVFHLHHYSLMDLQHRNEH